MFFDKNACLQNSDDGTYRSMKNYWQLFSVEFRNLFKGCGYDVVYLALVRVKFIVSTYQLSIYV